VGDDVVIYSAATILGRITIGNGATIGSNVWITQDMSAHTTVSLHASDVVARAEIEVGPAA